MDEKTVLKKRSYVIEIIDYGDGISTMERTNTGFTGHELLGIMEFAKTEIIAQMIGEFKPDIIKRTIVEEVESEDPFKIDNTH